MLKTKYMKKFYKFIYPALALTAIAFVLITACQKLDFSTVTKSNIQNVTVHDASTVKVEMQIFDLSDDAHPDYGVCYSTTNQLPTIADSKVAKGVPGAIKTDSIILQDLMPGSKIFIRAYVMNGNNPEYSFNVKDATLPQLPAVVTQAATAITQTTATVNGSVNASNNIAAVIFEYGATTDYGQTVNATPDTVTGSENTTVSANLTDLQPNSSYHYRVKANYANSGISFGYDNTFVTSEITLAMVTTVEVINITTTTATSGGNVTNDGGGAITARGVCWDTSPTPTISGSHTTNGSGLGSFSSELTGLSPETVYYVRAYTTNSAGTSYGDELLFSTLQISVPEVSTLEVSNITQTAASSGGSVNYDGGAPVTARGVCWSTSSNPTITDNHTTNGNGIGSFLSNLTGLNQNILYYVRAYATNNIGTAYGNQVMFTSLPNTVPTVSTSTITNITQTSATSGGDVTSDGGAPVTVRGVCFGTSQNPTLDDSHTTDGSGTGGFSSSIIGLSTNTDYFVRAYATNSIGTSYGNQEYFITNGTCDGITQISYGGQTYNIIGIGTQCWMAENLNIGTQINCTTSQTNNSIIEKYCLSNDPNNCGVYGGLYQWDEIMQYSISPGIAGICPPNWHLPTNTEWTILTDFLGGQSIAGGKMKEAGTAHWYSPNTGATNSSGFTGLPGDIYGDGQSGSGHTDGFWWSSTQSVYTYYAAYLRLLYSEASAYQYNFDKSYALSVRCLKDN